MTSYLCSLFLSTAFSSSSLGRYPPLLLLQVQVLILLILLLLLWPVSMVTTLLWLNMQWHLAHNWWYHLANYQLLFHFQTTCRCEAEKIVYFYCSCEGFPVYMYMQHKQYAYKIESSSFMYLTEWFVEALLWGWGWVGWGRGAIDDCHDSHRSVSIYLYLPRCSSLW